MYGNTYKREKNSRWVQVIGQNRRLEHRWCMFVALSTGLQETARYIKSITYHLPTTLTNASIKVTEPPFMLERVSWEEFEVRMVVEF